MNGMEFKRIELKKSLSIFDFNFIYPILSDNNKNSFRVSIPRISKVLNDSLSAVTE